MENDRYEIYFNTICSEIPIDYLKEFILTFLVGASADMGQNFDRLLTPGRVYDIIIIHYSHLPLNLVASAFKRGALGHYGPGKLVPRTIYGWLGEINQYFMTIRNKKDESYYNQQKFDGLDRHPMGKAICWKIDHISKENWDNISLKAIAEMLGRGELPTLEKFGIENKIK